MNYLVRDREVIFNLAGQVSHIDSMRDPFTDLEINCRSQLTILEACRRNNPGAKVVFAGTRQVYGKPDYLPVDERHLVRPTDVNGINKVAGEYYHLVYNNVFGVRGVLAAPHQHLRPAPAHQAQPPGLHRLVHPAGGRGRRDPDLRRRLAGARLRLRRRRGRRVPAGGRDRRVQRRGVQRRRRPSRSATATSWRCCSTSPARGRVTYREWPAGEEGHRHRQLLLRLDASSGRRRAGRRACPLRDGLARTVAYYREHFSHYVDVDDPSAPA